MPNDNCLEGIRCPKCGKEDFFIIRCLVDLETTDDGTGDQDSKSRRCDGPQWDDDSFIRCDNYDDTQYKQCEEEGTIKSFTVK